MLAIKLFIMSAINHLSPRYQIDSPSPADNDVGSHSLLNNNPTGNQSKQPALAFEEEPVNMTYHDTPASTSNIESRHIQHRETLHYVFKKPKLPQSYIKDDLHDTNGPGLEMRSTNDLEGVRNAGHSMNHHAIASQEHKAKERGSTPVTHKFPLINHLRMAQSVHRPHLGWHRQ